MKLSIIVPIYNVVDYLQKCVQSLIHQNYSDYEIVLVDDGSTDGSSELAELIHHQYSRVVLVHQENKGLSSARNMGVNIAKGDYVVFVDSDDFWEPNVLESLMRTVDEDDLDVLRFDYQNVVKTSDGGYTPYQPYKKPHEVDLCHGVCDGLHYLEERMQHQCYAVQFIVKRSLLIGSNLLFREGIMYEDVEWTPRMLLKATRVNSTEMIVYNYLTRQNSITTTSNLQKVHKQTDDKFIVLNTLIGLGRTQCRWLNEMVSLTTIGILTNSAKYMPDLYDDYVARLRDLGVFPLVIGRMTSSQSLQCCLINLSPKLFKVFIRIR